MNSRRPLNYRQLDLLHTMPSDEKASVAGQWFFFLCGARVLLPWFDANTGVLCMDLSDPRGIWMQKESELIDEITSPQPGGSRNAL